VSLLDCELNPVYYDMHVFLEKQLVKNDIEGKITEGKRREKQRS